MIFKVVGRNVEVMNRGRRRKPKSQVIREHPKSHFEACMADDGISPPPTARLSRSSLDLQRDPLPPLLPGSLGHFEKAPSTPLTAGPPRPPHAAGSSPAPSRLSFSSLSSVVRSAAAALSPGSDATTSLFAGGRDASSGHVGSTSSARTVDPRGIELLSGSNGVSRTSLSRASMGSYDFQPLPSPTTPKDFSDGTNAAWDPALDPLARSEVIATPTRAVYRGSFDLSRGGPTASASKPPISPLKEDSTNAVAQSETQLATLLAELAQKTKDLELAAQYGSQLVRSNQELAKQVSELAQSQANTVRKLELAERQLDEVLDIVESDSSASSTGPEPRKPHSRVAESDVPAMLPFSPLLRSGFVRERRETPVRRSTDGHAGRRSLERPAGSVRRSTEQNRGIETPRRSGELSRNFFGGDSLKLNLVFHQKHGLCQFGAPTPFLRFPTITMKEFLNAEDHRQLSRPAVDPLHSRALTTGISHLGCALRGQVLGDRPREVRSRWIIWRDWKEKITSCGQSSKSPNGPARRPRNCWPNWSLNILDWKRWLPSWLPKTQN